LSEPRQAAWKAFDSFDSLDPGHVSAIQDEFQTVPFLRFDEEAQDDFTEWRKGLEVRLRSGDLHPALEAHLAKYRKLVPALALICHLADVGSGPVDRVALGRALGFAEYLERHARRVYGAGPEAETAAAKAIISHIRRRDLQDGFTARDVQRPCWSSLSDRHQIQAGLNLLCDLNWIVAEDKKLTAGGRPTVHYRINPRVWQ
jgi:putative DNA primase/helicase